MTPLAAAQLEYVLANLWARGRDELQAFGVDLAFARDAMMRAADAQRAWCLAVERPVVAVALQPNGARSAITLFLATEEFSTFYRAVTAAILRRLPAEASARGLEHLEIHSASAHPKTEAWFKVLGFTRDPTYVDEAPETGAAITCYRRTMPQRGRNVLRWF